MRHFLSGEHCLQVQDRLHVTIQVIVCSQNFLFIIMYIVNVCVECTHCCASRHQHFECLILQMHAHSLTHTVLFDWFVGKPMIVHPFYSHHFCSSFSMFFHFWVSLLPLFICLFCPFVKRSHYFSLPQARDDDGLGGKLPQNSFTQDTPRLVFKTNSDVLVRTITI